MIGSLFHLLADRRYWKGLGLFSSCAVLAVLLGFVVVTPSTAERLIVHGGYYYILGVFGAWVYFGWRVSRQVRAETSASSGCVFPKGTLIFLLCATAFAVWSDSFDHKVLFDEYVLQGTGWHMHRTKEVATPLRAYDFAGTWLVIDTFLDKRPYFFMFLASLLHDLTGFRVENVFALNVGLAFGSLATVHWLVRELSGRTSPARVAVALLATLPLFGQNATAASMELLNIAMIGVAMMAALLYLRRPDEERVSWLILTGVLLAQSRYESVLFVFPIALVVVVGWVRTGRLLLPWTAMIAPLLLVPYAWHDRFVSTKPILWQLREGETTRFALHYVWGNLEGARNFFFSVSPAQPNSLWLALLGFVALAWAIVRFWVRRRSRAVGGFPVAAMTIAFFAVTIVANLALLMFYYWSRLDEPIAARFALPLCFVLAVSSGWFAHWLDTRRLPGTRIAAMGLAAWLGVFAAPAYAHRFYTTYNLVLHELDWELEQTASRPGPVLLITAKATMPFLLQKIPALNTSIARVRGPQIAWHLRQGTFKEVLVSQVVRPTSANGDPIVDPDEELPESFQLETITQKRFGARWIRISRLLGVAPSSASAPGDQP